MRRFPTEIQPDAMDCGPVSLKMIAKFYGKEFSLDKLRSITFTSKEGVSLLAISEAAEQIGFKTVGGRLTFDKLEKEALLPCIVHWNQEHFVVVYKIKPKNIFRRQANCNNIKRSRVHYFTKKTLRIFKNNLNLTTTHRL